MNGWKVLFFLSLALAPFSIGLHELSPLTACNFMSRLEKLYHAVIPMKVLQVHTCVAALTDFNPSYQLALPDGSNCSGVWGLRSSTFDLCAGTSFWNLAPDFWGCFYFALATKDPASFVRYNACLELRNSALNVSEGEAKLAFPGDQPPRPTFLDPDIDFSEEVVCLNEVLYLPTESAKIVVAAQTYELALKGN